MKLTNGNQSLRWTYAEKIMPLGDIKKYLYKGLSKHFNDTYCIPKETLL